MTCYNNGTGGLVNQRLLREVDELLSTHAESLGHIIKYGSEEERELSLGIITDIGKTMKKNIQTQRL